MTRKTGKSLRTAQHIAQELADNLPPLDPEFTVVFDRLDEKPGSRSASYAAVRLAPHCQRRARIEGTKNSAENRAKKTAKRNERVRKLYSQLPPGQKAKATVQALVDEGLTPTDKPISFSRVRAIANS